MSRKIEKKKILYVVMAAIIVVMGALAYQKFSKKDKDAVLESRKKEITQGVQGIFKNCPDISTFELRRECFKDRLIDMKSKNALVQKEYAFESKDLSKDLVSEDLEDLLKINIPENLAFVRCVSNTFFFDWKGNTVFISMENPLGAVLCNTAGGDEVLISPKNLSKQQRSELKNMFKLPIN